MGLGFLITFSKVLCVNKQATYIRIVWGREERKKSEEVHCVKKMVFLFLALSVIGLIFDVFLISVFIFLTLNVIRLTFVLFLYLFSFFLVLTVIRLTLTFVVFLICLSNRLIWQMQILMKSFSRSINLLTLRFYIHFVDVMNGSNKLQVNI